ALPTTQAAFSATVTAAAPRWGTSRHPFRATRTPNATSDAPTAATSPGEPAPRSDAIGPGATRRRMPESADTVPSAWSPRRRSWAFSILRFMSDSFRSPISFPRRTAAITSEVMARPRALAYTSVVGRALSAPEAEPSGGQVGGLLRHWRTARRVSQLDLALEADLSSRHLSFLETGPAKPSRAL